MLNSNGKLLWLMDNDNDFMTDNEGISMLTFNNNLYIVEQTKDENDQSSFVLKKYRLTASCNNPPAIGQFLCE